MRVLAVLVLVACAHAARPPGGPVRLALQAGALVATTADGRMLRGRALRGAILDMPTYAVRIDGVQRDRGRSATSGCTG